MGKASKTSARVGFRSYMPLVAKEAGRRRGRKLSMTSDCAALLDEMTSYALGTVLDSIKTVVDYGSASQKRGAINGVRVTKRRPNTLSMKMARAGVAAAIPGLLGEKCLAAGNRAARRARKEAEAEAGA